MLALANNQNNQHCNQSLLKYSCKNHAISDILDCYNFTDEMILLQLACKSLEIIWDDIVKCLMFCIISPNLVLDNVKSD